MLDYHLAFWKVCSENSCLVLTQSLQRFDLERMVSADFHLQAFFAFMTSLPVAFWARNFWSTLSVGLAFIVCLVVIPQRSSQRSKWLWIRLIAWQVSERRPANGVIGIGCCSLSLSFLRLQHRDPRLEGNFQEAGPSYQSATWHPSWRSGSDQCQACPWFLFSWLNGCVSFDDCVYANVVWAAASIFHL